MNEIFIPGNIPSLKNSKIMTSKGLFHSKTVGKFLRSHGIKSYSTSRKEVVGYARTPDTFRPYIVQLKTLLANVQPPYKLAFHMVRKTKAKFDFGNSVELLSDLFTAYGVWEDDNCDNFLPLPWLKDGSVYSVNPKAPGVFIKVVKDVVYIE